MLRITCLVIVVLVSISQSYGISIGDGFPIEIFTDFLSDRGHDHMGRRFKREPPPHEMDCCGDKPSEENLATMKKCGESVMKDGEPKSKEEMMKFGMKFVQCMLTETGMLTSSGLADKAKFKEILAKQDPDDWRRKQMEDQYDNCIMEGKQMAAKFKEKNPDSDINAEAGGFLHCQMRGIMKECPAEKFKADNKDCLKLRDMLDKKPEDM
ncbi:uncharacterized protein LOC123296857 [Chrysoperla carnea]|uniref:uncharacterized protein LOC123296857 n=1 Tax=Chrysoperla carnea TaxID=189513 RepID=UPI001D08A4FA|nr:uncharacterized protein LOC123296857 [Chrysoperla carnea]